MGGLDHRPPTPSLSLPPLSLRHCRSSSSSSSSPSSVRHTRTHAHLHSPTLAHVRSLRLCAPHLPPPPHTPAHSTPLRPSSRPPDQLRRILTPPVRLSVSMGSACFSRDVCLFILLLHSCRVMGNVGAAGERASLFFPLCVALLSTSLAHFFSPSPSVSPVREGT